MNLARLNHILIPATHDGREKLRRGLAGKLTAPIWWLYRALSDEGRVLAVLMLFIGTAGLDVGETRIYLLWSALIGLVAASLAVRRAFGLRARLSVRAPARVAVGHEVSFELCLRNEGDAAAHAVRLSGPFLPWDGQWLGAPPPIASCEPGARAVAFAKARFSARGEHQLDPFAAALLVPGGLALGPAVASEPVRLTVVPAVASVARLSLPEAARYQPGGLARASHAGEAMELMGVRPYRAGDPLRDLHPKTWARSGRPHVREYRPEFFARVAVLIDNDHAAGSEGGFEAILSLAAGIVAHLTRGEALVDLLVIGGRLVPLTVGRRLGSLEQVLDQLACARREAPIAAEVMAAKLEPYLSLLSALVLVTQSSDTSRTALCDAIERRGVACRIARVHDDRGRSARPQPPRDRREAIAPATAIAEGRALFL